MPALSDWLSNPLEVVQHIFEDGLKLSVLYLIGPVYVHLEQHHADANWQEKIREFFQSKINDQATLASIPSINCTALQQQPLRPGSLVRFRGMIQDMFDPELIAGVYETRDPRTQRTQRRCGLYSDLVDADNIVDIDVASPSTVTHERMTYYCVPVPGENSWVREAYASQCTYSPDLTDQDISNQKCKRALDQEEEGTSTPMDTESVCSGQVDGHGPRKSLRTQEPDSHAKETTEMSGDVMGGAANTPPTPSSAPRGASPPQLGVEACLVKVYDDTASIALNDCFEFIGILSVDPVLAFPTEKADGVQSAFLNEADEMEQEEVSAHCPPPSLVPRLHAIVSRKMQHNNPLLPSSVTFPEDKSEMDASVIRTQLHAILEQAFLGDKLAADYFLCHLISSVYIRKDVVALGKFSLNLTNVPASGNYSDCLHQLLQAITTQVSYLPMTLSNMNTLTFTPKKDYKANRLITGLLQLSQHTHLVLDETALTPGQLDANGVRNLTSLGHLISWQKVSYDFSFHKMDFFANVPVLILSEGKSLLPSDFQVPLSSASNASVDSRFESVIGLLTPSLLEQIRKYLTAVKLADYQLTEELQTVVQSDFVESRRQALESDRMTAEDFHRLLLLARLLSLSEGQTSLTHEAWTEAKRMEDERKRRLTQVRQVARQ